MTAATLTPAQLRELRCLATTGDITDLLDHGQNALAFYARDKVIGALERKGLIVADPDWSLTDAGRVALKDADGVVGRDGETFSGQPPIDGKEEPQ